MNASSFNYHSPDDPHIKWGFAGSLGFHFLIISTILLVAFLTHVKSLEELMKESGSIATSGPAPEQPMEVVLQPDDTPPSPPIDHPDFIREIVKPKPVPVVPKLAPPKPKPIAQPKPKFTAPRATGSGETNTISKLVIGSGGFPAPGYPIEAQIKHQTGTVLLNLQFDGSGSVAEAEVTESSGHSVLDANARQWVRMHWHNGSFANRIVSVPIQYTLPGI